MEDDSSQQLLLSFFLQVSADGFFNPMTGGIMTGLLSIFILLIFSALISGSEIAYFSISEKQKEELEEEEDNIIIRLLLKPRKLLATILVSNNLINVAIIMVWFFVSSKWFHFGENFLLEFFLQVIIVTFLLVLFGEVVPKVYATQNNVQLAGFMAQPLIFISKILSPITTFLTKSSRGFEERMAKKGFGISKEDLNQAIDITLNPKEQDNDNKILKGIVKLGNTSVKQIMQSRVDVVAIPVGATFEELKNIVRDSGYSRIPVFEDIFDNVTGIIYAKDLLQYLDEPDTFEWQTLTRPAFFVPENKKIDDLLKEFKEKRIHLAVVVDEYGGTSGIVTLEDILEEVIGEIKDEYDEEEIDYKKIDKNIFIFEGKTLLNDVCKVVGCPMEIFEPHSNNADSLAGLILEINNSIPKSGDVIKFKNFEFTIVTVNKIRIVKVKLEVKE